MSELPAHITQLLQQLPVYKAADNAWERLSDRLDLREDGPLVYDDVLREMPSYQASPLNWFAIESELPEPIAIAPAKRRRPFALVLTAAMVLVLAFAWFWNEQITPADPGYTITYSTEVFELPPSTTEYNNAQQIMDILKEKCRVDAATCSKPDFKRLENELKTIESDIEQLQRVLGAYHEEPAMRQKLVSLEQQRSTIIKSMLRLT